MRVWIPALLLLLTILAGCTGLLPKSHSTSETEGSWYSFKDISNKFDKIEVGKTSKEELYLYGFQPYAGRNGHILTFVDVIQKFMPSPNIAFSSLPDGVKQCINAKEDCFVFTIEVRDINKNRTGGFWADMLTFSRQTDTTGWEFTGFFIILDDTVVYKLMNAVPNEYTRDVEKRPLGPLQSFSNLMPVVGKAVINTGASP